MRKSPNETAAADSIIATAREALNKTSPTLVELQAAREVVAKVAAEAEAEALALADARPSVLLNGTDDELAKLDAAAAQGGRRRERAEAVGAALSEKIAIAKAEADRLERRRRYDEVAAAVPVVMADAEIGYREAVRLVRGVLRRIAELRRDVYEINSRRPEGAPQIADPNMTRSQTAGTTERSEKTVRRWTVDGQILSAAAAAKVQVIGDSVGVLPTATGATKRAELLDFVKVTTKRPRLTFVEDLIASVSLPGWGLTDRPGWRPADPTENVLAILDALENGEPLPLPPEVIEEKFVPVADAADAAPEAEAA